MASASSKLHGYGNVVISLENCIIPKEKLERTPSVNDGLNIEIETDLRIVGCEYIQTAGILLKLPQVAMATGQVLFQRFFYSKSFIRHDVEVYAMASLFLAAKIEECPRRVRDIINVFHHIKQRRNHKPAVPMDYMGSTYFALKNLVIKAERRILKELGFCVHVQHPHKVIITFLQVLGCEKNQALAQKAWNFMNDALRTDVFVRFQPETIACACIFLSARHIKIALPSRPPWWELFDVRLNHIEEVCLTLLTLYQRPKVSLQVLNKAVEKLKKTVQTKKVTSTTSSSGDKTARKSSDGKTFSRPGSPSSTISPVNNNDVPKSRSEESKKNGSGKTDSQSKSTKKSSKTQITRKENKKEKKTIKHARESPGDSDKSHSASESDVSESAGDSDTGSSEDSGSSQEGSRKKKDKALRQARREQRGRPSGGRKAYKSNKTKAETNSYRRQRSRSPHRRSRSRSRERRGRGVTSRNGDYKASEKRSGRR